MDGSFDKSALGVPLGFYFCIIRCLSSLQRTYKSYPFAGAKYMRYLATATLAVGIAPDSSTPALNQALRVARVSSVAAGIYPSGAGPHQSKR